MDDLISRQAAINRAVTITMFGRDIRVVGVSELESLPSVQTEKRTEERTETHACDLISRQAAIDALKHNQDVYSHNFHDDPIDKYTAAIIAADIDSLVKLPSAQPEPCGEVVSREVLVKFFDDWMSALDINCHHQSVADLMIIKGDIKNLPSAQSEIIRCKDCKFYSPMNRETKTGICNLTMHQNFGDNWFCAGAERRPNGFDRKTNGD